MVDDKFILVGKIIGVHGLHGAVKVYSYSGSLQAFSKGAEILFRIPGGTEENFTVKLAKKHKKGLLVTFKEIDSIDKAEKLLETELFADRNSMPELDDDTFYWVDLIGLKVFSTEETYLGVLDSILETGSNDVYVVKNGEDEVLIPALDSVILSVDLEDRTMYVDLPEGL
jgi:16S rRNA processing protein RimM